MSVTMMVPQDEHCIQRMLGVDAIPDEIYTEYMIRLRMFHRFMSGGGPLGPIGCIDLLRSMEYSPPSLSSGTGPNKTDWRDVPLGTPVQIKNEGQWSPRNLLFRFAGFVDFGTLAIQSPTGRVDEYRKQNVRLVEDDLPDDVNKSSFEELDEFEEEKTARQKAYEKQDMINQGPGLSKQPAQRTPAKNEVDTSESSSDTASSDTQDADQDSDEDGDDKGEPLGLALSAKRPDWNSVAIGSAVIVRFKEDTYDATFQGATEHRLKVVLNEDEDKKERYVRFDQVMLSEGL